MKTLGDARSLSPETQEALRIRAVKAVRAGMKKYKVAAMLGVSRQAVWNWCKSYSKSGKAGLKGKKRGTHKGGKLKPWQSATIVNIIRDKHPEQLKMPFYLWTREAVSELIWRKFGIRYSRPQTGRYLKKWGFTFQKPGRKALEQKGEEVKKWLSEEYPKISRMAKRRGAEILWADEMGVRSDAAPGKCYSPVGKTPRIERTGRRFSCSMISAISNRGRLYFKVFKTSFDVEVLKDFIRRLIKQVRKHVFLIMDRHPTHVARKTQAFIEENKRDITVFHLPPYSPELNPDELVNQDVKTNAVRRKRADDQKGLMKNVRGYLRARQCNPNVVIKYFHEENVRYAM